MFTIGNLSIAYGIIWLVLAIVLLLGEGLTLGLTFIWFAVGALLAALVSFLHVPLFVQIIVFLLGSIGTLIFIKPIAQKLLRIGETKTNVDDLIGKEAIVLKDIQPFETGQVKVKGQIWTAKSTNDQIIKRDENVQVIGVEGVKLIVK